jgi:MarR family transcriptional regulator for hemolysin
MSEPVRSPIGVVLARTAKTVSRVFDDALAEAGGSLPIWLILISLKSGQAGNQRELAEAVGIQGATLTYHLNAMEIDGLITRQRDPANRRIHQVRLTDNGEVLFQRLAAAAVTHDRRLRTNLSAADVTALEDLLDRLRDNVTRSSTVDLSQA